MAKRKMGIPFSVVEGGHMFPLEHPIDTVNYIKSLSIVIRANKTFYKKRTCMHVLFLLR